MKYLSAVAIELGNIREYCADWLVGILAYPFQLAALWLIWSTLYRVSGSGTLGLYSVGEMVSYYFGVLVLSRVISATSGIENAVWNDVIRGTLDSYLKLPISYPGLIYCRSLSKALITMAFGVPILLACLAISGHAVRPLPLLAFTTMAILGVTTHFIIWFLFGLLSFWMERIFGVRDVLWTAVALFSGSTLPLDLLPGPLQRLSMYMPLRYIYFEPLAMLLGRRTPAQAATGLVVVLSWIAVLGGIAWALWRRGLSSYESAGG